MDTFYPSGAFGHIETYFRDVKQHLGFRIVDYQVRGLKGIKSHWGRVFTEAYVLELICAIMLLPN